MFCVWLIVESTLPDSVKTRLNKAENPQIHRLIPELGVFLWKGSCFLWKDEGMFRSPSKDQNI